MRWRQLVLGGVALSALASDASAGIFFNRGKSSANRPAETKPDDRIGELARILRSDPDERRRAAAAIELSKGDFRNNPSIGHALIEALDQDPSINVREQVAEALGRLRPMTLQVGQALETALANDQSPRVRLAARNSLMPFIQAGYRLAGAKAEAYDPRPTPSVPAPPAPAPSSAFVRRPANPPARLAPSVPRPQTNEPPLADARPNDPIEVMRPASRPSPTVPADPRIGQPEPPRIPQTQLPESPVSRPNSPAPIITGPSFGPTAPAQPARPAPAKSEDDGPILNPPG